VRMGMELKEQTMSFMFLYYKCLKAIIIMFKGYLFG